MIFKPMTLYNPKSERVEWMVGGQQFYLGPKEKNVFDGFVAYHALNEVNTGLVIYEPKKAEEVAVSKVGYENLPWKELIKLGSKEGVFKPGMFKDDLIEALKQNDRQES